MIIHRPLEAKEVLEKYKKRTRKLLKNSCEIPRKRLKIWKNATSLFPNIFPEKKVSKKMSKKFPKFFSKKFFPKNVQKNPENFEKKLDFFKWQFGNMFRILHLALFLKWRIRSLLRIRHLVHFSKWCIRNLLPKHHFELWKSTKQGNKAERIIDHTLV